MKNLDKLSYALIIISIIGYLALGYYESSTGNSYENLSVLCGALFAGGILVLAYYFENKSKQKSNIIESWIDDIKKSDFVVSVPLKDCKIESTDDKHKLTYKTIIDNKKTEFNSETFNIKLDLAKLKIDLEEETNIYIDKNNPEIYYFNIEFIFR